MEGKSWQVAPDTTVQVVDPMGAEKDEGGTDETSRNWASIIISLSMIASVLLLVTLATHLMGPQVPPFFGRRLLLADLYDSTLSPRAMPYQWMRDDQLAYMSEGAGVRLLDLTKGTNTTLVTELAVRQTEAVDFSVSRDLRYVLLCHDVIKGPLYTQSALYSIYDVKTYHYFPLTLQTGSSSTSGTPLRLQSAQWAATESVGGTAEGHDNQTEPALVVVFNGSVYHMVSSTAGPVNLTPDSDPDTLTYGAPDLLNQETLQKNTGVWPSPSGSKLLVTSFNDSGVRELPVLHYGDGYPTTKKLRYPTVDSPLPEVTLWLYDLSSGQSPPPRTKMAPPLALRGHGHYVVDAGWADEGRVWAAWVAGDQASSALTLCSAPYWFCSTVLIHQRVGGVAPVVRGVRWAGRWAVFPWAAEDPEGSWHNHVALVGEAGGRRAPLTSSRYHITEVLATNIEKHIIYFRGAEISAMKKGEYSEQIYRTPSDGSHEVTCITCDLMNKNVRFSEKVHEETEEINHGGSEDVIPWDEWKGATRDINDWIQSIKTKKQQRSKHGNFNNLEDEPDLDENEEIEIGINGQRMYKQCRSVHGTVSPSSRYLVAVCLDDNGVPPSMWLIDMSQDTVSEQLTKQSQQSLDFGSHHEVDVQDQYTKSSNLKTEKVSEKSESMKERDSYSHPPLLLNSQTATRLAMGILGLPSTLRVGLKVGTGSGGTEEGTKGVRSPLYALVTLTIPPGWNVEDTSLLYPLVVQVEGPDEPQSPWWPGEVASSVGWSDYIASGHQTAHATVRLWGADPSAHVSIHQLAKYHVGAVRELLATHPYLDSNYVAVYGRGAAGAGAALEGSALLPPLYKCAALVTPVTDWHAYSAYWSNRLLGSPTEGGSEQRYVESNIARLAKEFRNSTPILLVHGTSDQFAHHGFSLAYALNEHAAHFRHVVYPNEEVFLLRPRRHLLAEMEHFLFSWLHDPLIYEDTQGNNVDETGGPQNLLRYENRFDIKRSFGRLQST